VPDLFLGQPLVVAARYRRPGAAMVTVRGLRAGQPLSFRLPVSLPERDESRPAVASVWARARLARLGRNQLRVRDGAGEAAARREEITAVALEHHLMSPYAAFVAVDSTRVTAGGPAQAVTIPVEVPEGVRHWGSVGQGIAGMVEGVAYGSGALSTIGTGAG